MRTPPIESRIGAAVNDDAAMIRPFGEIAMAPDAGKAREIALLYFSPSGSFQNVAGMDGTARYKQLAFFAANRTALVIDTSTAVPSIGPESRAPDG